VRNLILGPHAGEPIARAFSKYGVIGPKNADAIRFRLMSVVTSICNIWISPVRYREIPYEPTQPISDAAYFLGFDSIIAPNARWSCDNLILFTDQIPLADLEIIESESVDWSEWRTKLH
jgi:hypothetical protein